MARLASVVDLEINARTDTAGDGRPEIGHRHQPAVLRPQRLVCASGERGVVHDARRRIAPLALHAAPCAAGSDARARRVAQAFHLSRIAGREYVELLAHRREPHRRLDLDTALSKRRQADELISIEFADRQARTLLGLPRAR